MSAGRPEHRKLAAIMFTDLVGYSALAQPNGTLALELMEEHLKLVRPTYIKFGGREIKLAGHGFLAEECLRLAESTMSRKNLVKGWRLKGQVYLAQGKIDEGRARKLGAGLRPSAAGHRARVILRPELMEERVPVALDGLTGFLKQQKHDDRKWQKTLSSKVCGANAMTRTEIRGENPGANLPDEMKPMLEWRCR